MITKASEIRAPLESAVSTTCSDYTVCTLQGLPKQMATELNRGRKISSVRVVYWPNSPADLWGILSGPGNRVQTFFLD